VIAQAVGLHLLSLHQKAMKGEQSFIDVVLGGQKGGLDPTAWNAVMVRSSAVLCRTVRRRRRLYISVANKVQRKVVKFLLINHQANL
jgi:hypothetical protein